LIFTAAAGNSSPSSQNVLVYDPTGTNKSFRSGLSTPWFVTLPGDAAIAAEQAAQIVVQPMVNGLTPGTYQGKLTLQFSDGRVSAIGITFIVTAAPSADVAMSRLPGPADSSSACTPTQLQPSLLTLGSGFNVPAGFPQGLEAQVVDDCGTPQSTGTVFVQFSNGDPPVKLASLNNGRWDGTWATSTQQSAVTLTVIAQNSAQQIQGQAVVTGGLGSPGPAPQVATNGVVSAASFVASPVAPGGLITIAGQQLSDGTSSAPAGGLPPVLGSTTVTIGDLTLPLAYASGNQVNALVPFEVSVNTNQQLLLQRGVTYATPVYVDVAAAQPGVFQNGLQGIVTDLSGNLIGPSNPAHAGDYVVIYCTGLGAVNPVVVDGAPTPSGIYYPTVNPVTSTIGGQTAQVLFAGLTSGFVGLYQVNVGIPQGVSPGDQTPVVLSVAGQASSVVTISVR
jgi:uncharacterized protein (TIGR03437 family)